MNFPRALAFDVDGTLTEFGAWSVHPEIPPLLNALPLQTELALCSGRPLERQKERLAEILKDASNLEAQRNRWTLITENGCAAYRWNVQKQDWVLLFETEWPTEIIAKEELAQKIRIYFLHLLDVRVRHFTVVCLFPRMLYFWPACVRFLGHFLQERLRKKFQKWDLLKHLNVESSGLGSLIFAKNAGKGKAVAKWTQALNIRLEDTHCFGDSPHGNDHELLSGHYGQPHVVTGPRDTAEILNFFLKDFS